MSGKRGLFLVLEGVEGAGKTTQVRKLAEWVRAQGRDCVVTREPGGTALGEEIRQLLLEGTDVPARSELLLLLAARAALVDGVIRPALDAGRVVIADRYDLSTLAYQAFGRDLDENQVRSINAFATGELSPDLTILLDVPTSMGAERSRGRGSADRIEREHAEFHERVGGAYRLLAQRESNVERVDGTPNETEVHHSITRLLERRFPETFHSDRV
jgi:dTMP kinase